MCGDRERAKTAFEISPETLDRIQLRTVGRQINRKAASVEDRFADDVHLVDVEVVHDDDVAGIDPRRESLLHEAKEGAPVDGRFARHDLRSLSESDCADERHGLPRAKRSQALDALTTQRAAVLATHSRLHEGFVDENEALEICLVQERAEFFAPFEILWRVALRRDEGLFFRENPSRASARVTPDRLVLMPERRISISESSATVASGVSATIRASNSATWSWIGERLPPPRGRGSSEFVSRCKRKMRLTVARPMPSNAAISSYVRPSARARRTAARSFNGVITTRKDHVRRIASSGRRVNHAQRARSICPPPFDGSSGPRDDYPCRYTLGCSYPHPYLRDPRLMPQ